MKFSVVVPTYNRATVLAKCLAALQAQTHQSYEVIVVDDGSSDDTTSIVQGLAGVRYLRQENKGPAAARNLGVAGALGEVVAFTDDDCVVPSDWLEQLDSGYNRHPDVVGVGGLMEAPSDLLIYNVFAQYEQYVTRRSAGAGATEFVGGFDCPAGGTNNMSYRKWILQEVGGFDASFPFAAGEDADMKWRICQKGHQLLYVPVKVTHLQTYTWRGFIKQSITRGRGAFRFEKKWASSPGRARITARLAWRFLVFLRDLATMNSKRIAVVKFVGGAFDCVGQMREMEQSARLI